MKIRLMKQMKQDAPEGRQAPAASAAARSAPIRWRPRERTAATLRRTPFRG